MVKPAVFVSARSTAARVRLGALVLALAAGLVACGAPEQPRPQAPAAPAADTIDWFKGPVDAAFASAATSGRPVLLYWGAEWCPDCKQLKSSVFTRADFIARTRQFVPVYLDGDQPGAQAFGDTFRVAGYPTLVVLTADRREVTRVTGGMDLTLYAATLDAALADLEPIAAIVAAAAAPGAAVTERDCRRLAWHGFGLEDADAYPAGQLTAALANAAERCAGDPALGLRLQLLTAARVLAPLGAGSGTGPPVPTGALPRPDGASVAALRALHDLLAEPAAVAAHIDILNTLPRAVFTQASRVDPTLGRELARRVAAAASVAAGDDRYPPADQLYAERLRLAAEASLSPDGKAPPAMVEAALSRARGLLAANPPGYVHASLVTPTLYLYADQGDWESQRTLLQAEAANSKNAHYYLGDLARVEEQLGNTAAALDLYARAWARAEGTATRAQWGYDYLSALLRLAPDDTAAIEATGLAVLDDLGTRDNVRSRTRARLAKLGGQLAGWASTPPRRAVVATLQARLGDVCRRGEGPADGECSSLFPAG